MQPEGYLPHQKSHQLSLPLGTSNNSIRSQTIPLRSILIGKILFHSLVMWSHDMSKLGVFCVLLTAHLSVFILVINQLDAQIFFVLQ